MSPTSWPSSLSMTIWSSVRVPQMLHFLQLLHRQNRDRQTPREEPLSLPHVALWVSPKAILASPLGLSSPSLTQQILPRILLCSRLCPTYLSISGIPSHILQSSQPVHSGVGASWLFSYLLLETECFPHPIPKASGF